jgi:hypothetical protein
MTALCELDRLDRMTGAVMTMKKFDLEALERAYAA